MPKVAPKRGDIQRAMIQHPELAEQPVQLAKKAVCSRRLVERYLKEGSLQRSLSWTLKPLYGREIGQGIHLFTEPRVIALDRGASDGCRAKYAYCLVERFELGGRRDDGLGRGTGKLF